jgi:GNAT superfamily N-acetyltransferase
MKNVKVVTVTDEEQKDLYTFLNKSLSLSYERFLSKHFEHPKFRKELFFLLKTGDEIISTFANRDVSIFNSDLNAALFGDVATLPEYRRKGCMKFLVRTMLKKLQEEKDLIISPWTGRRKYKVVYSKLGFSRIEKLETTYEFYKDISKEKKYSKVINFHKFRMRDRKIKMRRQIFFTLIFYIQYLCLVGIHILQRSPKICNVEKLEELNENNVTRLNELFIEYSLKRARIFFERDEETWHFIYNHNDVYLIKHNGENVGYAIGSFLKDCIVMKEICAKDPEIYFYAISHFEELARKSGKNEIIIWADSSHRSLARCGYIPNDLTFIIPFDPRGMFIVRSLKNFFEKINVDCKLSLYDPLLDSYVKIGKGDFSIHLTQKDMADLIFGGSVICTLFKARVRPMYKMFSAYKILSKVKKEHGIEKCLRTRLDLY